MWRQLVVSLLSIGAHAWAPAPIRWGGMPSRKFVIAPKAVQRNAAVRSSPVNTPQTLTIWSQSGRMSPEKVPQFAAKQDKTISWMGLCVEASGDQSGNAILISECTGGPNQLWDFVPSVHGGNDRIRLTGTSLCWDVARRGGHEFNGAAVELQECGNQASATWKFEEPDFLSRHDPYGGRLFSFARYHVAIFFAMAAVASWSLGAWWWRWQQRQQRAFAVALNQGGSRLSLDQGGICLTAPLTQSCGGTANWKAQQKFPSRRQTRSGHTQMVADHITDIIDAIPAITDALPALTAPVIASDAAYHVATTASTTGDVVAASDAGSVAAASAVAAMSAASDATVEAVTAMSAASDAAVAAAGDAVVEAAVVATDAVAGAAVVATDAVSGAAVVAADAVAPVVTPIVAPIAAAIAGMLGEASVPIAETAALIGTAAAIAKLVALDDGSETSFTAIARWPALKLFTFGECAFCINQATKSLRFPGSRVSIRGDPIPCSIGQAIGYRHTEMIPLLDLENGEDEEQSDVKSDVRKSSSKKQSLNAGRLQSVAMNLPDVDEKTDPEVAFSPRDGLAIFADSDWSLHDMTVYSNRIKDHLQKRQDNITEILKWTGSSSDLQTYRMALLTKHISYVDTDESNMRAAVKTLNAEMDPLKPRQKLFEKPLEHVMTIQFFTPASYGGKALNQLGFLFSEGQAHVKDEGIAHNVHLLKDSDNNGYLTFQGTTNLATWVDIHFSFGRYDPFRQQTHFASNVDDARWEAIERGYLYKCHAGFCETLKAFVSSEQFPRLAKEIAGMKSLSILGFSLGGSLASMFATSVHGVKDLQGILDRLRRDVPFIRALWPEDRVPEERTVQNRVRKQLIAF